MSSRRCPGSRTCTRPSGTFAPIRDLTLTDAPDNNRPLDVDRLMADLSDQIAERAANRDDSPLFSPGPPPGEEGLLALRDVTPASPRPIVGPVVTKAKRGVVRAVWPVLEHFSTQINSAITDMRTVRDEVGALRAELEALRADLDALRQRDPDQHLPMLDRRVEALEDLQPAGRLARLEEAASTRPMAEGHTAVQPIDPAVGALAASRARIDDAGDERLPAYWAVLDPAEPIMDVSWDRTGAAADLAARGFDVQVADTGALATLEAAGPASLGGLTALGLGDHLSAGEWLLFVRLAAAALRPGAGLVLEMINPTTAAGMSLRSRDPSLQPPVHPETIVFLLRAAGFADVDVRYLGAFPDDARAPIAPDPDWFEGKLNELATVVNHIVVGEPLVAVLARR